MPKVNERKRHIGYILVPESQLRKCAFSSYPPYPFSKNSFSNYHCPLKTDSRLGNPLSIIPTSAFAVKGLA